MKCGVGDYSFFLANALASDQSNVVGVLTSILDNGDQGTNRVQLFPVVKKWTLLSIIQYIKILRDFKPNIVHIQYPTQGYGAGNLPWFLPSIAWLFGKKVVQTWHEGFTKKNAIKLFFKGIIPGALIYVKPEYQNQFRPYFMRWVFWNKLNVFIKNASVIPVVNLAKHEIDQYRITYIKGQKRLIVFFGFMHPEKRVELLFSIANPLTDIIVIAGEFDPKNSYHQEIYDYANSAEWSDKVQILGFLAEEKVAKLLAIADAIILPFASGGGAWNTSLQAASQQGSFVITTAKNPIGYDQASNIYYSHIDDVIEMKLALEKWCGTKKNVSNEVASDWNFIAHQHLVLYTALLNGRGLD
ncbi:glycosyltransferase [Polynucleobacter sp. P1-05-14]|uniref:glycosyltransferase n=1 Tax=Polynucleobacter sp. P1-05-14 TaxID=1819732 RepID=UPI001C0D27A2|nr:glycosyltransferase [Polynucleobacter sp. P1-05-14]MBU3547850.1 glycosyltransferase [Polynucleobacter sp. P1-05-14]